jgi:hypothetical protein
VPLHERIAFYSVSLHQVCIKVLFHPSSCRTVGGGGGGFKRGPCRPPVSRKISKFMSHLTLVFGVLLLSVRLPLLALALLHLPVLHSPHPSLLCPSLSPHSTHPPTHCTPSTPAGV